MARPPWSGPLSFGPVSLPVRMFTAPETRTFHFRQLQRGTSDRVRSKRVNEGDAYALVEQNELDEIIPRRSRTIDIEGTRCCERRTT
ncbi:hypothetical protein [Streptomyces sp. NPDC057682]|uniref:hypothetical protein n=1 Tax=unclassified Streptomyces TaxID=2593676 RepID=UPI003667EF69